jgi:hypothetical protein
MGQRYDKLRGTTSPAFGVGNGRPGNKSFQAAVRDYSPPEVRWNDASKCWEFTEDGIHFFPLGTHFIPAVFSSMSDGDFGYVHAVTSSVMKTDAGALVTSRCTGAHVGVDGRLMTTGVVQNAKFSPKSDTPGMNAPVFLARNDDDISGAAGTVSTKAPSSGVVAEVGLVVGVDPLTFPSTRRAAVLLQVKTVTKRDG